jgi:hypothetical protein
MIALLDNEQKTGSRGAAGAFSPGIRGSKKPRKRHHRRATKTIANKCRIAK